MPYFGVKERRQKIAKHTHTQRCREKKLSALLALATELGTVVTLFFWGGLEKSRKKRTIETSLKVADDRRSTSESGVNQRSYRRRQSITPRAIVFECALHQITTQTTTKLWVRISQPEGQSNQQAMHAADTVGKRDGFVMAGDTETTVSRASSQRRSSPT